MHEHGMLQDDVTALLDAYEARSERALVRRQRAGGMEFVLGRREGAYLWDATGTKRLLDCATSGGVHTLGHRHPEILAALMSALGERGLDAGLWTMPNADRLAMQELLAATAPGPALCRSVLTLAANTSNDLGLLFAFRVTGRRRIVAYRHGYHGHTGLAAMATGSRDEGVREYYNMPLEVARFFETYGDIDSIRAVMDDDVAAVIVEPFDYETFAPAPAAYLHGLKALCRRHGALLIADETRTGLGRSGRLWMCEHAGLVPDMLVCGKGLSGGLYPMSALLVTEAIYDRCMNEHEYGYASSLAGNEIGATVGRKVLEIASRADTLAGAVALEERMRARFHGLCQRFPAQYFRGTTIGGIATLGVQDPAVAADIRSFLFARGVLSHSVSAVAPRVIKFLPVITAGAGVADEIADALEAFAHSNSGAGGDHDGGSGFTEHLL